MGAMVGSVLQGEDALGHVPSIDLPDISSGSSGNHSHPLLPLIQQL